MTWSKRIRQTHRGLSVTFTALVIVNIVLNLTAPGSAPGSEQLALWVGLFTLIPLALLMFSGLYSFVLPYLSGSRAVRPAAE